MMGTRKGVGDGFMMIEHDDGEQTAPHSLPSTKHLRK
jgi:hypothetical protein